MSNQIGGMIDTFAELADTIDLVSKSLQIVGALAFAMPGPAGFVAALDRIKEIRKEYGAAEGAGATVRRLKAEINMRLKAQQQIAKIAEKTTLKEADARVAMAKRTLTDVRMRAYVEANIERGNISRFDPSMRKHKPADWQDVGRAQQALNQAEAVQKIVAAAKAKEDRLARMRAGPTAEMGEQGGAASYAKLSEKIEKVNTKLKEQLTIFAQGDIAGEVMNLAAEGAGLAADFQAKYNTKLIETRELMRQVKEEEDKRAKAKEMVSAAESIFEATRTPLERYETQIGRLDEMLNSAVIGWETYGRAVAQAREQLEANEKMTGATGTFKSIRTALVDVKGLGIGGRDPVVKAIEEEKDILVDIHTGILELVRTEVLA